MQVAEREIVNDRPMATKDHVFTEQEIRENYVTLEEFHQHLQQLIDDFYHHKRCS